MDLDHFTPWMSLAGGLLIGLSAAMMLLLHGRVAGISGIFNSLFTRRPGDYDWRLAFIAGLVVGGVALVFAYPQGFGITIDRSPFAFIAAGLIVGFGTQQGSGCTSGHGVCGIGRMSRRSIIWRWPMTTLAISVTSS